MAKQLLLHSFFKTNPIVTNRLDEDKRVINEVLNVTSQVEKNITCEKKSLRRIPIKMLTMQLCSYDAAEKATIWKKEFAFWNTEDGKVI